MFFRFKTPYPKDGGEGCGREDEDDDKPILFNSQPRIVVGSGPAADTDDDNDDDDDDTPTQSFSPPFLRNSS